MYLDNSKFLDSVLRPVTTFLEHALGGLDTGRALSETAEPLIKAIEAVPGSGRMAVFVNAEPDAAPSFISGPSFETQEVGKLAQIVATQASDQSQASTIEAVLPGGDEPENRVRMFLLRVPQEQPMAILVTVRDPDDDDRRSVFDAFMDQVVQLAGVVVEDRRLRTKIAEQQSVLEALLNAAPDAIIRINRAGVILGFMGGASKMFGWSPGEIIGRPISTLMPEPHATRHDDYIEAFLSTGERKLPDFGRRLQARHKSGSVIPIEVALSQLPDHENIEFIGIVRDISVRIEREGELDAMREALDAAALQSALGELAATIAHELNQPLTAIANYMDALELRLGTPNDDNLATAKDLAGKTAAQARLGAEIIRRTKRMALKGETEAKMDHFGAAVAEALSMVSKTPVASSVEFRLQQTGEDAPALFDRIQIQQVVTNLTTNACRAMANADRRVLSVETNQSDGALELTIADTGPGVSDRDKAKIFDRFFRRSRNGMGLGLSIVQRIAVAHGGDIRVDDATGGGAKFILKLPRRVI